MSYSRQPSSVATGTGLKQTPAPTPLTSVGVIQVQLEAEIATSTSLGVVQVGSGLTITPEGILSATGSGSALIPVLLVSSAYTATYSDFYIGVTKKDIQITFPMGIIGKEYIIKNKSSGNITVKTTSSQKIDSSLTKILGSESSLTVVFDGDCWSIV